MNQETKNSMQVVCDNTSATSHTGITHSLARGVTPSLTPLVRNLVDMAT